MSGGRSSRDKGARGERAVVAWLQRNGFPYAERRIGGMDGDKGDITGIGPLVVEVKDRAKHDFPAYHRQLLDEMTAAGVSEGFVIAKRRQHANPGDWYALLPAQVLIELLRQAGHGDGKKLMVDASGSVKMETDEDGWKALLEAFAGQKVIDDPGEEAS